VPWLPISLIAESVTPLGSAAGDITSYILGYGVLGVAAVLLVLRVIVPGKSVDEAVQRGRADLVAENQRLIAENARLISERDAALKIAQEQVVPLLTSFVGTTSALLPLLQDLVAMREVLGRDSRRGRGDQ
jgi:hypothetical protein